MRIILMMLMILVLTTSFAYGGIVSFDPATIEVNVGEDVGLVFTISVESENNGWESIDMIIGSDTVPINQSDWAYSDAFASATLLLFGGPSAQNVYPYGIGGLGGFSLSAVHGSMVMGYLTVDTSVLPVGEHTIMVDSVRDGGLSNMGYSTELEPLSGMITIHVVPEPVTLVLMGLGGLALIGMRRTGQP